MEELDLKFILKGWDSENLSNLLTLLGDKNSNPTIENVEQKIKWLYHSRFRAETERGFRNTTRTIVSKITKNTSESLNKDDIKKMPTYDLLLSEALKHVKAVEKNATREDQEMYLSHAVIIGSLQKMKPSERKTFFEKGFGFNELANKSGVKSPNLAGPISTIAALGTAQLSGFGVYMGATTALGFVTNAIGVTLPFAVYTGLSSSIAFAIGPAGWLTASIWTVWKITGPKWKKIIPGLIYIIAINSHRKIKKIDIA